MPFLQGRYYARTVARSSSSIVILQPSQVEILSSIGYASLLPTPAYGIDRIAANSSEFETLERNARSRLGAKETVMRIGINITFVLLLTAGIALAQRTAPAPRTTAPPPQTATPAAPASPAAPPVTPNMTPPPTTIGPPTPITTKAAGPSASTTPQAPAPGTAQPNGVGSTPTTPAPTTGTPMNPPSAGTVTCVPVNATAAQAGSTTQASSPASSPASGNPPPAPPASTQAGHAGSNGMPCPAGTVPVANGAAPPM